MFLSASPEQPQKISYGIHTLTRAGKELYDILSHTPNNDFFVDFAEHVFNKSKTATIRVHKVNYVHGNTINYDEKAIRIFEHT